MKKPGNGFTLVEILVVITLIGILSVVAIPQFIDMRTEAKDEATRATIGAMRSALSVAIGAIALKENPNQSPTTYPTYDEVKGNRMLAVPPGKHANLDGTPILDKSGGIPPNVWTGSAAIHNCEGKMRGSLLDNPPDDGWCYNPATGELWANSDLSRGPLKENLF